MHALIARHRNAIAAICEQYAIAQLDVFGSAARAHDFDPAKSDADFLVEFSQETRVDPDRFFGAKTALEQLLGRSVDLVESAAVRNPYLLADINRRRELVYAA